MKQVAIVVGALMLMLLAGTGQAFGNHVGCGDVVTTNTKLDSDLVECPGDGLVIGADGITVNLDGHLVDGSGANQGIDNGGGFDSVRVRDGRIRDFFYGIYLDGATGNIIRGITARIPAYSIWIAYSSGNVVKQSFLSDGPLALFGDSRDNRIARNSITAAGVGVVSLADVADFPSPRVPTRTTIEKNVLFGNDYGIVMTGGANRIVGNTLIDNTYGMQLQSGSGETKHNWITGGEIGIRVAGTYQGRISRNEVHAAEEDGIQVLTGASPVLERNLVEGSGDDGIDTDSRFATITRSSSNDNGDLGIEAVAGVTDGGGNRASGNGNAAQCTNVVCN